jgi:hypothetical protein
VHPHGLDLFIVERGSPTERLHVTEIAPAKEKDFNVWPAPELTRRQWP